MNFFGMAIAAAIFLTLSFYERVQAMNTSEKHTQKQAENEHIREMTVEQVASIMEDTIGYKFERSHKIAQALAKLGCIRIMGGV